MTLKQITLYAFLFCTAAFATLQAEQTKGNIIYPEVMEFIVSDIYPVSKYRPRQVKVTVHNLDDTKHVAEEFNKKLQALPKRKRQEFIKKMQRDKGTGSEYDIVSRLQSVTKGRYLTAKYGLSRYPAVIFNEGESVVYGITDVKQAIMMYSDWVKQQ